MAQIVGRCFALIHNDRSVPRTSYSTSSLLFLPSPNSFTSSFLLPPGRAASTFLPTWRHSKIFLRQSLHFQLSLTEILARRIYENPNCLLNVQLHMSVCLSVCLPISGTPYVTKICVSVGLSRMSKIFASLKIQKRFNEFLISYTMHSNLFRLSVTFNYARKKLF